MLADTKILSEADLVSIIKSALADSPNTTLYLQSCANFKKFSKQMLSSVENFATKQIEQAYVLSLVFKHRQ